MGWRDDSLVESCMHANVYSFKGPIFPAPIPGSPQFSINQFQEICCPLIASGTTVIAEIHNI